LRKELTCHCLTSSFSKLVKSCPVTKYSALSEASALAARGYDDFPEVEYGEDEYLFVPSEGRVRGAANDKLYRRRGKWVERAMGVRTVPVVVDTGDGHAGRAVRRVVSQQQRPDSPVVRRIRRLCLRSSCSP
jgi:hypothetical protein